MFPNTILFFLPKNSTIVLAGICINIPNKYLIEFAKTTSAALRFFICVKNKKSIE